MDNAITAITTSITPTALWGEVEKVVPFATMVVLFGFGFYLVRRMLRARSLTKGRAI